jgi:hypothetical protein
LKAAGHLPPAISWGALAALLVFAQTGYAQSIETSVDLSGAALRYADTLSTGTYGITPRLLANWRSVSIDASGTYSRFTSGGSTVQGAVSASRFVSLTERLIGELAGFTGGSSHDDGTRTGEFLANGRLHFARSPGELFVGAGGGRAYYDGGWQSLITGELGAAVAVRGSDASLTISPAMVSDSIKYTDAQASVSWRHDRLELTALLGHRFGDQLTALGGDTRSWVSLSATQSLTPRFALVASGGSYPIDPTQGFPGGRYVSVSLRIETHPAAERSPDARQNPDFGRDSVTQPSISSFTATRARNGTVTLTTEITQASSVEVSGDFTNWVPLKMIQDPNQNGVWRVTLPIAPGKYQMNLRVDGGAWVVPPGLLPMRDEFGGAVGLLTLE